MMAKSHFPAHGRWQADSFIALAQLNEHLVEDPDLIRALRKPKFETRQKRVKEEHAGRLASFANLAAPIDKEERLTAHNVGRAIKHMVPSNTVFVIEAVTNAMLIADQLWISLPGSWSNCGLGWSGGAALGVKLALDASGKARFALTVVLNNKGWNAPRKSLEFVHPDGLATTLPNQDLHVSFDPSPDNGGIAEAGAG
ncbi:MAG: hypothetical protein LQ343_005120 [Gyalolechia ehrenbergii]|nr:MAG: hypothetical protein LQ343_005120 [Gyalolechia ehrenbergii]